jgi:lysophospholipase L1-like esterase
MPSALKRFDRDVLSQASVKYLIILEGINDIGIATRPNNPIDPVSADDLIFGLTQMIERAHTHGIKVYLGTIMPDAGLGLYYSEAGESERHAVNQWIRATKLPDGVIDFDKALRDPDAPKRLLPAYDRDHIHPNDAGHKAMADAVDLRDFIR